MSNSGELGSTKPSKPLSGLRRTVDPTIGEWFEREFWPAYPRHEAKSKALQAAAKATTPERRAFYLERLQRQLPEYQRRRQESGQRVIPLASTWFNQDRQKMNWPFRRLLHHTGGTWWVGITRFTNRSEQRVGNSGSPRRTT